MSSGYGVTAKQRILSLLRFLPMKRGITLAELRNPSSSEVTAISAESEETQCMAIHILPGS